MLNALKKLSPRLFCHATIALPLAFTMFVGRAAGDELPIVDLQLVIAVDVSFSMDEEELRTQREGYVDAFQNPLVVGAILAGSLGRIGVTYVEWGGTNVP